MENKRHYTRILFSTPAVLKVEHRVFDTSIIDLSLKGALISTPDSLGAGSGQEASLEFVLNDSDIHIEMKGIIAHCEPQSVGLTWTSIDIESMTHLRRLLSLNVGNSELLDRQLEHLSHTDD